VARLVIAANASKACLYLANFPENPERKWSLIEELTHPSSRAKASELVSDAPGSVVRDSAGGHRPTMEPPTDPKEHEAQLFARKLARRISQVFKDRSFDDIAISASPGFLGLLRAQLDSQVLKQVVQSIDKDFTSVPQHKVHQVFQV